MSNSNTLLIQNECLLAESISKDICSVVLTPNNVVPISVEPCSNYDKEQTKNLELEAKFSKVKQLLVDKERRCSHIETEYLNLELKFQKYKECFENPQLKAHINNMKDVSTGPSLCTLEIENTKLKEGLTAVRIKNDSLIDENVSIKERFQELYKSKAGSNSSVSNGATILVKPKAVASGLYAMTPKYVPPQKRINRETNSSLPRKETVTVVDLSNVPVNLPTGIKSVPDASKSKSKSVKKIHKNLPARSKKVKRVAKPPRNLNKNRVDFSLNDKCTGFISKSVSVCKTCNERLVFGNHDECVVKSVNAKKPKVINNANVKQVWKATGKVFASVGSRWKPTGRKFTLGDTCPLTRINKPEVVSIANSGSVRTSEPTNNVTVTPSILVFQVQVIQIVLWYLDSGCSRHMTGDRSKLINYVEKFIGTVRFGNDQFAAIVGYGDYKIGDTIITRVYYVEGLNHNIFLVGQFCDGDLEVAFRKNTCFIRNKDKVDLLKGSRISNLYSISLKDMLEASPVCLLSKASSTKSWLWHRRLNHLNFGTLNELARKDLV
ncbi:integrase, catalytic region, zinc finger, CCHC-type containing protein [Tanacetum coccineum]